MAEELLEEGAELVSGGAEEAEEDAGRLLEGWDRVFSGRLDTVWPSSDSS